MSIALQLLIGMVIGALLLSAFGWSAVILVAVVLAVLELAHDLRLYRRPRRG